MTAQRGAVRQHDIAAHQAVVGDVPVGHQVVAIADARDMAPGDRAAMDGDELAEHVLVADHEPRGFALVLQVLRCEAVRP